MTDPAENFTLENLILAIQMFSNRKEESKEKFKEAEHFLKRVEKSKLIWIRSHELLTLNNLDNSVRLRLIKANKNGLYNIRFTSSQPSSSSPSSSSTFPSWPPRITTLCF